MILLPCNLLFQIRKIVAIILSFLETKVLMSAISHEFIKFLIPTTLCRRICVGTWNVGGKLPPDDLDIDDWIDMNEPADIYVLG